MEKMEDLRLTQHAFARYWSECGLSFRSVSTSAFLGQNCMQDFTHEVVCSSNDCPIFYRREKARVDLEEKRAVMNRIDEYYNKN